jgi:hypothetical protein
MFRPQLPVFAAKVFGLNEDDIRSTPVFKQLEALPARDAEQLLLAKILAYAAYHEDYPCFRF